MKRQAEIGLLSDTFEEHSAGCNSLLFSSMHSIRNIVLARASFAVTVKVRFHCHILWR
jgi:hypothetical protein